MDFNNKELYYFAVSLLGAFAGGVFACGLGAILF